MSTLSHRDRTALTAIMAHELRTPLSVMLLLAEQLAANDGDTMTEQQVEYSRVIHACGKDLMGVVDSLLDLARSEAGALTAEFTEVDIAELRSALCREFAYLARGQLLELLVEVAPDVPDLIVTDHQRLRQILTNLLGNAIKFTPQGDVRVCFAITDAPRDAATDWIAVDRPALAVSVIDTGIGIAPEDHERIFESFAQAHHGRTRRSGGAGLGLAISRELAELLGGRITVSSRPGEGSTFTLYLPLDRPVNDVPLIPPRDHAGDGEDDLAVTVRIRGALRPVAESVIHQ
ncbi:MAG TPA: ATP-binding protein [Mycobacteriales bacterium]|nr:ATP-binding protein [Mycobacteriales bacterium]